MSVEGKAGGRRRLIGVTALLLASVGLADARAQKAPADADFEAALRADKPSRNPADDDFEKGLARTAPAASAPSRAAARESSGRRTQIAPAGALPSHWRGVTRIDDATWRQAAEEAKQGLLDPHAFAQTVFGKLPLPPGASAVRCRNSIERIWFTLGKDVPSAEYARLLALDEKNGGQPVMGQPDFLLSHLQLAEKATAPMRAELGRYFASIGWQKIPDASRGGRDLYIPAGGDPDHSLRVGIYPDAYMEQVLCKSLGVKLPTGPIMELRLPRPRN